MSVKHVSGIELLIPNCPDWMKQIAEVVHSAFLITPGETIYAGKNVISGEFRSIEHGVKFDVEPQVTAFETPTQVDVTPLLMVPDSNAMLQKWFPNLAGHQIGWQGQDLVLDGKVVKAMAQLTSPMSLPPVAVAQYVAGVNSLTFVKTLPESYDTPIAANAIHNRVQNANAMISTGLWHIVIASMVGINFV